MLVPTLNYYSCSPHIYHGTCHIVGRAFVCLHHKRPLWRLSQSCLHNACCLLVTPETVASQKKKMCNSEILNHLFSWTSVFTFSFKSSVTKDRHPFHSKSRTLVLPSLNNQHHFLTIPSFTAPSLHILTIYPWISARKTFLAFTTKNRVTNHISQVAGFSCSTFMAAANGGKKWHHTVQSVLTCWICQATKWQKVSLHMIQNDTISTYQEVQALIHALTSALAGDKLELPYPGEKAPSTHQIGLTYPRAALGTAKEKNSCPCQELNASIPVIQSVAWSLYWQSSPCSGT